MLSRNRHSQSGSRSRVRRTTIAVLAINATAYSAFSVLSIPCGSIRLNNRRMCFIQQMENTGCFPGCERECFRIFAPNLNIDVDDPVKDFPWIRGIDRCEPGTVRPQHRPGDLREHVFLVPEELVKSTPGNIRRLDDFLDTDRGNAVVQKALGGCLQDRFSRALLAAECLRARNFGSCGGLGCHVPDENYEINTTNENISC